jgi:hypothetical protein
MTMGAFSSSCGRKVANQTFVASATIAIFSTQICLMCGVWTKRSNLPARATRFVKRYYINKIVRVFNFHCVSVLRVGGIILGQNEKKRGTFATSKFFFPRALPPPVATTPRLLPIAKKKKNLSPRFSIFQQVSPLHAHAHARAFLCSFTGEGHRDLKEKRKRSGERGYA